METNLSPLSCSWSEYPRDRNEARTNTQFSPASRMPHSGFHLSLAQDILTMLHFLPFEMVTYVLCHCMLELCDLLFDFDLARG